MPWLTAQQKWICTHRSKTIIAKLIFVTAGSGVLFSSRCTFLQREREILANVGYFVANLRTFLRTFTARNNALVYQNWKVLGINHRSQHHQNHDYDEDDHHHNRFKELQTINVWGLWGGSVELYKLSTAGPIMDWIVIRGPNLQRLYFNNANQSTTQGSIYFVGPELDICPFWPDGLKQLKRLEDWNKSPSLRWFLLRTPTIFISTLVPPSPQYCPIKYISFPRARHGNENKW